VTLTAPMFTKLTLVGQSFFFQNKSYAECNKNPIDGLVINIRLQEDAGHGLHITRHFLLL
jgi:hypothetical protein